MSYEATIDTVDFDYQIELLRLYPEIANTYYRDAMSEASWRSLVSIDVRCSSSSRRASMSFQRSWYSRASAGVMGAIGRLYTRMATAFGRQRLADGSGLPTAMASPAARLNGLGGAPRAPRPRARATAVWT